MGEGGRGQQLQRVMSQEVVVVMVVGTRPAGGD